MHAWVFSCFHNPRRTLTWTTGSLTCVLDYSYACVYTRGGWAHRQRVSTTLLTRKTFHDCLLCSRRRRGSNLRCLDLESDALPTESPHTCDRQKIESNLIPLEVELYHCFAALTPVRITTVKIMTDIITAVVTRAVSVCTFHVSYVQCVCVCVCMCVCVCACVCPCVRACVQYVHTIEQEQLRSRQFALKRGNLKAVFTEAEHVQSQQFKTRQII